MGGKWRSVGFPQISLADQRLENTKDGRVTTFQENVVFHS